jgi:hypothetical protein
MMGDGNMYWWDALDKLGAPRSGLHPEIRPVGIRRRL